METLEAIDRAIVLAVNGCHSPFWDEFMWIVSGKTTWIPVYLILFFLVYKNSNKKEFLWFVIGIGLSVGMADLISSQVIKETVERYRPSHHALLTNVLHFHLYENGELYRGGMYGFVSNHATNFGAIATWVYLFFHKRNQYIAWSMILGALLVGYSRLYLGVHYLSDVIGGFMVGTGISVLIFTLIFKRKTSKV